MNILICAVGGQGALLASKVIGQLALNIGLDVKASEVHGMSQRGGSVVTHVKYGEKVYSPIIEKGDCDIILAFEELEAVRYLEYLKKDGVLIVNRQQIKPMPVITGATNYPENLIESLRKLPIQVYDVDGVELANGLNDSRVTNTILLGILAKKTGISKDNWIKALADAVPNKAIEVNISAFELGYQSIDIEEGVSKEMIWNSRYECLDRDQMRDLQNERLRSTVKKVYENVEFYRNKMISLGVTPEDIKGIEDLYKLPFTTKQDLRENYPYKLMACNMNDIVEIHASSGTTGKPIVITYTDGDIKVWEEVVARALTAYGISKNDILQVSFGYGLFTGGLGLHYGGEKIEAAVVPISGGNTDKQVRLMKDFNATAIACTPSYALHVAEVMEEMGIGKDEIKLKVGIFGAEPWTEEMRLELEDRFGIKAYDIYGLTEIIGPGVAFECSEHSGLHINEDHFLPEIIDPNTEKVLANGEKGELVFTTISKTGMPLLRYKTRDLTSLHQGKCNCGRNLVKMEKCLARSDDMLIIRGVNVFPSQIESVLLEMGEVAPHYQLIVDRKNSLDTLEILVETEKEKEIIGIKEIETLNKRMKKNVESVLGIGVNLKLVQPKTIQRSEGKAKRIIDKRKIKK